MAGWVVALVALGAIGWAAVSSGRKDRAQITATAERRPNPTRPVFLALMAPDVSAEAANFLWDTTLPYLQPNLTPHPNDNLFKHLPIDEEDIILDWPQDWAKLRDFHVSNMPDWPEDWPATIRNFGRWLDMAPC